MTYKINLFYNLLKTLDSFSHLEVDFCAKRSYTISIVRATRKGLHKPQAVHTATGRERNPELVDTGVQFTLHDLIFATG